MEEASSAVPACLDPHHRSDTHAFSILSFLICQKGFRIERVNICEALKAVRDRKLASFKYLRNNYILDGYSWEGSWKSFSWRSRANTAYGSISVVWKNVLKLN